MKITTMYSAVFLAMSFAATSGHAAPTAYANIGTVNTEAYSFTATTSGSVTAYFVGADAYFPSNISLLVNGVDAGASGLDNHTSVYGDSITFNGVTAGDKLVLRLNVTNPIYQWFSDTSLNTDGRNHVYSNSYVGDSLIPAGVYVAFEDSPKVETDWDYNDATFVLTNTSVNAVPVPATAWLFGSALVGFVGAARRRSV